MDPSGVDRGMAQSSASSGIFFQGDGQSHVAGNSNFGSIVRNSTNSSTEYGHGNVSLISGDVSNRILNSVASSGPSVGASSLVTDANSGLSGRPHLQRSASINTESYVRLPASPISFSSNNISMSASSVMDGSSVVQQNSNQDIGSKKALQGQQYQGASSSSTSLPQMAQGQFPGGSRVPNSYVQDQTTLLHLQKKPRLDRQNQVLQQLLQIQNPMHLHNQNLQLQTLIQQQRLRQQGLQVLQVMPPLQRVQLLQQQQQQQLHLRQQLQLQGMPAISAVNRPYDGAVCSRRMMKYLYHHRQRPTENAIAYWRQFVSEYYSPRAKKRWCLSRYVGHHSKEVFPQLAMDVFQCDICGSNPAHGYEASFEVLPRLNDIKFRSGVIDELLFLDMPHECRLSSGMILLEYSKAVQESVYEKQRVVQEGQLRILFTPDLKILSWEFCVWRHEELFPRRLVAPQVNQLLQVVQKCLHTVSDNGADGMPQDLQENSALVLTAGRQLARTLELPALNDLGFSKSYVRCLQIADVVNSMKDVMDFCKVQNRGPIEGLKNIPSSSDSKFQGLQGLPTDCDSLNKLMSLLHPGFNGQMNSNGGTLGGSAQAALAVSNFQNLPTRLNSICSIQQAAFPFNNSIQALSSDTPVYSAGLSCGTSQDSSVSVFSSHQAPPQQPQLQQLHSPTMSGSIQRNQPMASQGSQALQPQIIQQLLQDVNTKSNNWPSIPPQNRGAGAQTSSTGSGLRSSVVAHSNECPVDAPVGRAEFDQKESDLPQGFDIMDDDMGFTENGFFSSEIDDDMNFSLTMSE